MDNDWYEDALNNDFDLEDLLPEDSYYDPEDCDQEFDEEQL